MRSFEDQQGRHWQVALLDGSYGNIWLMFSPLQGSQVLQVGLDVENMAQGLERLEQLGEEELRELLARAEPWG